MCPELLIIGKWLLACVAEHQLTLAWLFSAWMSQMPTVDETKLGFLAQWSYRGIQLVAANIAHLQKKG
jgi:hypothetical protein